jgi:hypothetical protein
VSDTEQEWRLLLNKISDEIFSNLISCHNLSHKIKQLRGKTFYLMGRTIRLLNEIKIKTKSTAIQDGVHISILPLSKWDDKIIELIKLDYNQNLNDQEKSTSKASKPTIQLKAAANTSVDLEQSVISQQLPDYFNDTQNEGGVEISEDVSNEAMKKFNEQDFVEKLISTVNRYDSQSMEYLFQSLNIAFSMDDKVRFQKKKKFVPNFFFFSTLRS